MNDVIEYLTMRMESLKKERDSFVRDIAMLSKDSTTIKSVTGVNMAQKVAVITELSARIEQIAEDIEIIKTAERDES